MDSITDARVFLIMMGARKVGNSLYAWGGETENEGGYDCSGFVSHVLTETNRAWPGFYTGGRQTAKGIYAHFDKLGCPDIKNVKDLKPGCLAFYFTKGRTAKSATHVALHVANVPEIHIRRGDSALTADVGPVAFEAGGAGSKATSPRAALRRSATIRVTATDTHGGQSWVAKDPFLHLQRILDGEVPRDIANAVGAENSIARLARETAVSATELERARKKVNAVSASRYNRTQEVKGAWKLSQLPAPLKKYPTDSFEFALLVAVKQRELDFRAADIDGKLGPGTLKALTS